MPEDTIFYIVSDEYIEYLSKIDTHVMQNKPEEFPVNKIVINFKKVEEACISFKAQL